MGGVERSRIERGGIEAKGKGRSRWEGGVEREVERNGRQMEEEDGGRGGRKDEDPKSLFSWAYENSGPYFPENKGT